MSKGKGADDESGSDRTPVADVEGSSTAASALAARSDLFADRVVILRLRMTGSLSLRITGSLLLFVTVAGGTGSAGNGFWSCVQSLVPLVPDVDGSGSVAHMGSSTMGREGHCVQTAAPTAEHSVEHSVTIGTSEDGPTLSELTLAHIEFDTIFSRCITRCNTSFINKVCSVIIFFRSQSVSSAILDYF